MSLAQCIPQENINLTENRLQMIEKNIFSLWETLISFIEARRTSREHVKNEGRYWTRQLSIRERHKGSQQSRSPHRPHHVYHQRSESLISLAASQSDIDDGSESHGS